MDTTARPSTIRWEESDDHVVTLVLDDPDQAVNTMNAAFIDSLDAVAARLWTARDTVRGVIVTSAKKSFFAGGDLRDLVSVTPETAGASYEAGMRVKRSLRVLETLGKPVVAAINGAALGGGYEIALACHHRVVLDAPGAAVGLPEVTLGLLPGGGGVTRTVRMFGVADALHKVLLEGTRYAPARALEAGLVDEIAARPDELLARARAFIDSHPVSAQPWDAPGYRIPGGTPADPALAAQLPALTAMLKSRTGGAPGPAPRNILAAAVESSQVDVDTSFAVEAGYLTELVTGQIAKNMIQAFFDLRAVDHGAGRPQGIEPREVTRVAVLGAGMMGAGIAHSCAAAGLDVVLKDLTAQAAAKGKSYSEKLCARAVFRGTSTREKTEALLARITPTGDVQDLAGCDVVIEAVFEDTALKHQVFHEIREVVAQDALLCSNTSTLPITTLAEGVQRPQDFIGLHFFSPVDRMPLVEIIKGGKTGDEALARAFDLVRRIGKTPIVVNDSRGFFTSRVIGHFIDEGVAMVGEGIDPASVEQAAAQAGYPAKVLNLMDELTLTLPRKIREENRRAVESAGRTWEPHPADTVVDRMIDEFNRPGRSGGAGFYDYADGRRTGLWPGLREHFTDPAKQPADLTGMMERMLFVEALDAVRCLEEGVLVSVADANIGSLLGIGFPPWTGGVLQYVNGYQGGLPGFVARARELAQEHGERFAPPALLVRKAEQGETFTDA
ncbi:3-hydroxyacyl-CoA dehydrogenase NAD-binding domain-containing protein [Streptomyces sp. NBC_00102]|uniref:3-hydroxyacyl-CoA dehydrogenase NAD-binding domain-containing protein n=1 Tax=Streptomyces sp. NBC_00102 TaxID=2975652 RepID=UPI00225A03FE|nr:3-hydroxyacyl-CoA dehydrogenase NAD-binding domain-containing protein [Streptomyces sp. NBC_00102]MCX5402092.1 3-hydroxyacyl-CoA dehydrogenase NAD-binding domain-containing protein [Streptomyces sp. NBC_00102]